MTKTEKEMQIYRLSEVDVNMWPVGQFADCKQKQMRNI